MPSKLQRWSKRLGALPSLALPTDYPRPSRSLLIPRSCSCDGPLPLTTPSPRQARRSYPDPLPPTIPHTPAPTPHLGIHHIPTQLTPPITLPPPPDLLRHPPLPIHSRPFPRYLYQCSLLPTTAAQARPHTGIVLLRRPGTDHRSRVRGCGRRRPPRQAFGSSQTRGTAVPSQILRLDTSGNSAVHLLINRPHLVLTHITFRDPSD